MDFAQAVACLCFGIGALWLILSLIFGKSDSKNEFDYFDVVFSAVLCGFIIGGPLWCCIMGIYYIIQLLTHHA